jgi:PAS domain S-box-containing protein
MGRREVIPLKNRSFSFFILISMILVVLCIVAFFSVNDYLYTRDNFEQQSHLLEVQTEQNIDSAMRLTDIAWNIFDDNLNERMKTGLDKVHASYNKSGGNPAAMDLQSIRQELGGDMDIYLINESGVIVYTTYQPELGQDFRKIPYFYDYLTKIRLSSGFFPDRVVHELLGEGQFRKYAYMPTADHKYVLELGLAGTSLKTVSERLDTQENIDEIVALNPYITQYRIFNTMGRRSDNNKLPEKKIRGYLNQTIAGRKTLEIVDPEKAEKTRYLFIDLKNNQSGSDLSRVVEITYNTGLQQEVLNRLILYHIVISLLAVFLGCAIALILSRRQIRPIQKIVSDVDIIARGNLDHRIGPTESREFAILEQSINTMIDSLKTSIRKIQDGETFQQEMIDQLPVGIFLKRVENGRYVYWNKSCEQMFGRKAVDIIGRTDRELFQKEAVDIMENEDREACDGRVVIRNKVLSSPNEESRVIHMIIASIRDSQGNLLYLLGIAEDVTPENLNLRMDLLFSITRHEILNQLSEIMGSLERAQLKHTHEDVQIFFDRTLGSVESIKNQIAFMRSLQDLGIISPAWQSVKRSFEDAIHLSSPGKVAIQSGLDGFEIFADPLFPRIFHALLENSLRHGGPGLSAIGVRTEISQETFTIIYEDNGTGIPADRKLRIFEPEYGEGTGMSLFIIRELLGFTGMTISETGIPGKGVRFEIVVPKDKFRRIG